MRWLPVAVTFLFGLLMFVERAPAGGDTSGRIAASIDGVQQHIYVVNAKTNTITIYDINANGNVAPVRTIGGPNTGIVCLRQVAVDSLGNLYVANFTTMGWTTNPCRPKAFGNVLVFASNANGNVAPIRTLGGPATRIDYATALAIDTDGTLYVGSVHRIYGGEDSNLLSFAPGASGNVAPLRSLFAPVLSVDGMTLNPPTGLIVSFGIASDATRSASGLAYVNKNLLGARNAIGGDDSGAVAIDTATHTYLALVGKYATGFPGYADSANRYAAGTKGSLYQGYPDLVPPLVSSFHIATCPVALAMDLGRTIYVAGGTSYCPVSTISAFAPDSSGNAHPIRQIKGSATQLASPEYVTIGP